MLSIAANDIRDGNSDYRLPLGVGIAMTGKLFRALPDRVHVALLIDFRSVRWAPLPLTFVANITIGAVVWHVADLLVR
jgi:hypothetical protein